MQLWSQLKHPHKSWWGWGESFRNLFVSIFESTVICPNPFGCVMVSRDIWTTHICMPSFDYIPFLVPTFAGSFPLFDSCRCWHSHTFVPPENYHLTVYKSFDDHFWQWMTSIVYHGECLHIDTHKRWQMANLVSNCVVNLWWLWMFMAYIYIQYTSVISLWGKATCIMFAGPRSLGQGYHFSSHLGGIWK
jgi:hypothetical protein